MDKKVSNSKKRVNSSKKNTNIVNNKKKTTTKKVNNSKTKKPVQNKKTSNKTTKKVNKKVVVEKQENIEIEKELEIKKEEIIDKKIELKDEKKKNKIIPFIFVSLFLIIVLVFLFILLIYPSIKEKNEINKLKNEIRSILKDNGDISLIKSKYITSGSRVDIEDKIEDYLIESLNVKNDVDNIIKDEKINNLLKIDNISDGSFIEDISNKKEELNKLKENINVVNEKYNNYSYDDDKLNELYKELYDEISEVLDINTIDNTLLNIEKSIPIISYLNDNKSSFSIEENKIVFNKRNAFDKYNELVSSLDNKDSIVYELINDTKGPVISASDITINKGTSINIKDKVKCVDEVDGDVECSISGTYNKDKAGTYKITINGVDKSNNKSSKTIKVIVKEKLNKVTSNTSSRVNTSNKPYYIEVIRNQNVVIVYGLDENKEYSKIVKVFTVSVGKNGKTPTGTYKTTKGYAWGALIHGVWGQYTTRITGSYLFHSVPYYSKNKGDLEWQEYNKLGTAASAGCVRMRVVDVKWIYDNVENGTTVKIYDGSLPSGISKPSVKKIDGSSPNRGWDPTDPDRNNPWK